VQLNTHPPANSARSTFKPSHRNTGLREFRKANEAVGLRIKSGKFTFVSRKLLNIFIFIAQKAGAPGVNAPTDDPGAQGYFWVRMSEVIEGFSYLGNNTDYIKQTAHEMQSVKVIQSTGNSWTDEVLLSGVKVWNSLGLGHPRGEVWIGFAFPPTFQDLVLHCENNYTKYSLYYQTVLSGAQSLALYEICRRYATSPTRVTYKQTYEYWYHVLTGIAVEDGAARPEYKYFKRDVLKTAIAEINKNTDIEIELIEFKENRRVEHLQFRVSLRPQASLEFEPESSPGPLLNMNVVERIMRFGIPEEEACQIYARYSEGTVLSHINLVEMRQKSTKGAVLDSPAAYFKVAIANGYASSLYIANPLTSEKALPAPPKDLKAELVVARSAQALSYYSELSEAEQARYIDRFSDQADKTIKWYLKKKGLKMKIARTAFGEWLAMDVWGEATESDIIAFHNRGSVI
jgi:plasmid replication initiation protein